MLRTNSKAAREAVRAYILEDLDYLEERFPERTFETFEDAARAIWEAFESEEKHYLTDPHWRRRMTAQDVFEEWASGLALGGLFLYYYSVSAVDLLGDILQETPEERGKYTEQQAERLLTYLIFSEVSKAARR